MFSQSEVLTILIGFFIIYIGNKFDLKEKRQVQYEEGWQMANNNNMSFFETSAKEDVNVTEAFYKLTQEILLSANEGEKDNKDRIVLVEPQIKNKKCC
jgi:GTPase SAR1 family protein